MPIIKVTREMLNRGEALDPGWYNAKLKGYSREANKNKNGINLVPTFEVTHRDEASIVKELKQWFPENSLNKTYLRFYGSITETLDDIDFNKEIEVDTDEPRKFVGNSLWVHLVNDTYQGKIINKIDDYLPASENPTKFDVF